MACGFELKAKSMSSVAPSGGTAGKDHGGSSGPSKRNLEENFQGGGFTPARERKGTEEKRPADLSLLHMHTTCYPLT